MSSKSQLAAKVKQAKNRSRSPKREKSEKKPSSKSRKDLQHAEKLIHKAEQSLGPTKRLAKRTRETLHPGKVVLERAAHLLFSRALALPAEYDPPRWASVFNRYPTAIARILDQMTVPQNVTDETSAGDLPASLSFVAVTRNPWAASIIYYAPNANEEFGYQFYGAKQYAHTTPNLPAPTWFLKQEEPYVSGANWFDSCIAYGRTAQAYSPHGTIWGGARPSKEFSPDRFYWLDAGTRLTVSTTVAGGGVANLERQWHVLDRWTPTGIDQAAYHSESTAPLHSADLEIDQAGYYRLSFCIEMGVADSTITFEVTNCVYSPAAGSTGSPATFGHRALPHLETNYAAVGETHILGASVLYSNKSPIMNLQGRIVGYQPPPGKMWYDYVSNSTYDTLADLPYAVALDADKGMYGFVKPSNEEDFFMTKCHTVLNDVLLDTHWPLDSSASYFIICSDITAKEGRAATYSFGWGVEYQTADKWRNSAVPPVDSTLQERALIHIAGVRQFVENPLHLSKIWSDVKGVVRGAANAITKYGPTVLDWAGKAASVL